MNENTLEALQKQVGGHIEAVTVAPDLCAICNEEGLLMDLPYMGVINHVNFFGPVLLVGVNGEDFCDVPVLEVEKALYSVRSKEKMMKTILPQNQEFKTRYLGKLFFKNGNQGEEGG